MRRSDSSRPPKQDKREDASAPRVSYPGTPASCAPVIMEILDKVKSPRVPRGVGKRGAS